MHCPIVKTSPNTEPWYQHAAACHNRAPNFNHDHLNALCLTTLMCHKFWHSFCLLNIISKIRARYCLGIVQDVSIGELTIQDNK